MFPPRLELGTFRVWGERDNHYTTETTTYLAARTFYLHRAKMALVSIYITKDIHGTRRPTYKDAAILLTRLCDKMVIVRRPKTQTEAPSFWKLLWVVIIYQIIHLNFPAVNKTHRKFRLQYTEIGNISVIKNQTERSVNY